MKVALLAIVAAITAGCAAQPTKTVNALDSAHPNYSSAECLEARKVALQYNDNTGARIGIGIVSGLLLGPFGIPIAALADAAQNEKRKAINIEIEKHCAGVARAPVPAATSLTGRLQELQELRMKGLITEAEHDELRRKAMER